MPTDPDSSRTRIGFLEIIRHWLRRYFSDEQAVVLFLLLACGLAIIMFLGEELAPLLAAIIFAFTLQGAVSRLVKMRVPHSVAVGVVFTLFLSAMAAFLLVFMPLVWGQISTLVGELPRMLSNIESYILLLPREYPEMFSEANISTLTSDLTSRASSVGQWMLTKTLSSIPDMVALLVYVVLVPILVFFFLKDRDLIVSWISTILPDNRSMISQVWREMDVQIANYIRGKVVEILIVGVVTYGAFFMLGTNYAALLAILVGISVLVPYIGAAVITVPVAVVGLFQWGWSSEFIYLMAAYGIIQGLDGNVLVPLLFSEVVNLHPVVIIVAVLVFGGIWGVWGVFFAIPLATLVKAVLRAWPKGLEKTQG